MAWEIRRMSETGSTNEDACVLGDKGAPGRTAVTALSQTRGRGRMNRSWFSPPGSGLYLSALVRPEISVEQAGLLSFCAANAMTDALRTAGCGGAGIKWPNDIVIGGRKVCGILSVCRSSGGTLLYAVIGTGVNLDAGSYPPELKDRAVCLTETGVRADREELMNSYLKALDREITDLEQNGFEGVRKRTEERCVMIDRNVTVSGGQQGKGRVRGIGPTGELLLETEDGREESIFCGDVSVRGEDGYV